MKRQRARRASVAVEFALISFFFLLPLTAVVVDALFVLTAQAQLNTTLQALYYYALANPTAAEDYTSATTITQQNILMILIDLNSNFQITLDATPDKQNSTLYYYCQSTSSPSTAPSFVLDTTPATTPTCKTGTVLQYFVKYAVSTPVSLPIPIPGVSNPWTLNASGMIEVQ